MNTATAPSLQDVLEMPSFVIVLPKDKGYSIIHNSVIGCDYLSSSAQGILHWLLSLPADWDGDGLYYKIMKRFKMCKCTAYKRIHELEDAGHLHRIIFRGLVYNEFQKRHKVTEMRFIRENPRERIWIHNALNQPYHVRNSRMSQRSTKGMRRTVCLSPQPIPEPEWKRDRFERRETPSRELTQSARARRRAAYFDVTPIPTFSPSNKGRKKKILSSKESKPLTPFAKGDSFSVDCRVVAEAPQGSKPTPETAGAKEAAAPPAPRKPSASARRAAFDAAQRTAPWADSNKLEPLVQVSRTVDRYLKATWGVHVDGNSIDDDIEAFLRHPVTGMLQLILGRASWTYAEARRWRRKAGRGMPASEILAIYRAYSTEFRIGPIGTEYGHIPGNVRDLLRHGGNFRRAKCSPCAITRKHFEHDFIPYDQCLARAEAIMSDRPWSPADLLENDFN